MTSDIERLHEVASRIAEGSSEQSANQGRVAARFESWMAAELPGRPADELALLAYLLTNEHWSWGYSKAVAQGVDRHLRRQGHPPLAGTAVSAYLTEKGRREGKDRLPKTEPLRSGDITQIAAAQERDNLVMEHSRHALPARSLRALLVASRNLLPPEEPLVTSLRALIRTGRIGLVSTGASTILELHWGTSVVRETLDPERARDWAGYLEYLQDNRYKAMKRLRTALGRTGLRADAAPGDLSDAQWRWLWANCDPDAPRRIRDLAYTLLGHTHARRHAELGPLQIEDVRPTGDGYLLTYRQTKNGTDHTAPVGHVTGGSDECLATCAACAVDNVLEYERVCRGRTTGPLLATTYAKETRAMTRQNGRFRVLSLTELTFGEPRGSTRSLRVGAATSAAEMGWSLPKIMQLTGHLTAEEAARYVRRSDSPREIVQVPLQ